ncbi:hypothetical protein DQ04_04031040 [Trypanosoma grayi]|uniref:hypothetical protein n=1 Tax=Trypanosoma grayi TaxID=71804 RepID=UPI0004F40820|nr:hypothetical protein DQ04_04031040 [Trypanosoma grayi]KEG10222.1 hypothetical protein DQ04_04031040 [Trypanosoma grayi]
MASCTNDCVGSRPTDSTNASPNALLADSRFRVKLCDTAAPPLSDGAAGVGDSPAPSQYLVPIEATTAAVEFSTKVSLVNALSGAYTSSGYPSVISTSGARPSVYGAFVELRNPSLQSVTLPPEVTVVTAAVPRRGNDASTREAYAPLGVNTNSGEQQQQQQPLLRVVWRRGSHLFNTELAAQGTASPTTPRLESPKSSPVVLPKSALNSVIHHLRQYPDGIHDVQTSQRLDELLLGLPPSPPLPNSGNDAADDNTTKRDTNDNNSTDKNKDGENVSAATSTASAKIPAEEEPTGDAPVQLTLVTASSFNHLGVYAVRHQEGRLLASVPLQTLTASLSTRKITAHYIFLLCADVDGAYVAPGASSVVLPSVLQEAERQSSKKTKQTRGPSSTSAASSSAAGMTLQFEDVQVENRSGCDTNAMRVATLYVAFEPYMLVGNQNGDILLFSIFERKVVQRLNYGGGAVGATNADTAVRTQRQLVSSSVSCIAQVEYGVERRLATVIDGALSCRIRGGSSFTIPTVGATGAPPSVFAVGFDNGHVLLVNVTLDGARISRHITSFGHKVVQGIAMRVPSFFTRLWPTNTPTNSKSLTLSVSQQQEEEEEYSLAPGMVTVPSEALLIDEDTNIAAVSCDGGVLRLVRAPELEQEVCRTTALRSNAVGDFLALQWVPSCADAVLRPDLLIGTNEDDSITAYQLHQLGGNGTWGPTQGMHSYFEEVESSVAAAVAAATGGVSPHFCHDRSPLTSSQGVRDGLVFLTRRNFHRSWVSDLCALPLPDGYLLTATSYDSRTSFWPLPYRSLAPTPSLCLSPPPPLALDPFLQQCFSGCIVQDVSVATGDPQTVGGWDLSAEPAAAVTLHADPTVRCTIGGAGKSFFLVSLCLRGRLKFWEVKPLLG